MERPRILLPMRAVMAGLLLLALDTSERPRAVGLQDRVNAPVISNLKFEPSEASRGSRVLLRIQVFDRQGREDIIPILHLLREGMELIRTRLYDDGSNGDNIPSDGFYTGLLSIPLTASSGPHWFVVFLYDNAGHRSNLLLYEFWVSEGQQFT